MRPQERRRIAIFATVVVVIVMYAYLQGLIGGGDPQTSQFAGKQPDLKARHDIAFPAHDADQDADANAITQRLDQHVDIPANAHLQAPRQDSHAVTKPARELTHDEMVERAANNVFPGTDKDHLHGKIGYKADGTPAWTPLPPLTSETFEEKREHHKGNCFNLRRSDALPLDRYLADMRHPKCRTIQYPDDLPIASVVFVFYNEPPSPLYRSIHSVLNRTPPHLLHEIVLVDDCSDAPALKEPFEEYLKTLPKIKLVRLTKRSGLMTARTAGARAATGEVVVFLDSHIECTEGWLEPMLARIKEDRKHVVMPIIDSIDADLFTYHKGGLDILGFTWRLGQQPLGRPRTSVDPMPSVIMAGGLFALDRKLFQEIGEYDPEMQLYGGEEMEISFRIWQCGMTLECIPCSRVGHVFRTGAYWQGQVYKVPGEVIIRNKLRAAEVWMDEYKEIVFDIMEPGGGMDLGPLEYMRDLRKRLQCKPFKWFLQNVFPELFVPFDEFQTVAKGEVRNPETNACFDTLGAASAGASIGAYPCHGQKGTQFFVLTSKNQIRVPSVNYDSCLDRAKSSAVNIWSCHSGGGNQYWNWDQATGRLQDETGRSCVEVTRDANPKSPFSLIVAECSSKPTQVWKIGKPVAAA